MFSRTYQGGLVLIFGSFVLAACGGSSSPAQPVPVPTVAPTPVPTPTPKPLSVIPPCPLPAVNPTSLTCPDPTTNRGASRLAADVNAAIDRTIAVRPDLFDLDDWSDGGPKIKDYNAYNTAVVAALGEAGLCGHVDAEGEIGVKATNDWGEQWSIWMSKDYPRRKYLYGCTPALF
jgi:hypothetical protein